MNKRPDISYNCHPEPLPDEALAKSGNEGSHGTSSQSNLGRRSSTNKQGSESSNSEKLTSHRSPLTAHWYAIYTRARTEKRLHDRLQSEGYESYLPLIKTLRQWSDRKKWVEVPLLNSYVFVRTHPEYLREVIKLEGAARYISFEGKPAAIPEKQIDNLRLLVNSEADIEVTGERLSPGDPVEVTHGSLRGLCGELIKLGNKNMVVVRIDRLDLNLVVKIQKAFLKKLR